MEVSEILKKVRRIQIVAHRQVDDLLAGAYRSVFKGRGMDFDEVREYSFGDDVRSIDWNVTARAGQPYIKRFAEERELTVLFLVDMSRSGHFGTQEGSKLDLMIEMAALLMFSAQKNNDKIGLACFAGQVEKYFPPRKGRSASWRLLRELVSMAGDESVAAIGAEQATNLREALEFVTKVHRRRAVVFVLSDFRDEGWEDALRMAKSRHDVIAITVEDPREAELIGLKEKLPVHFIEFEDPETGELCVVDSSQLALRKRFAGLASERRTKLTGVLRRNGVDELAVRTDQPYAASLHRFFRMRERRAR